MGEVRSFELDWRESRLFGSNEVYEGKNSVMQKKESLSEVCVIMNTVMLVLRVYGIFENFLFAYLYCT